MSVVGTVDQTKSIIFSLTLGIRDFVLQILKDLCITLPLFLYKNTLSNAPLSQSELYYVRFGQFRNINLMSIVVLS